MKLNENGVFDHNDLNHLECTANKGSFHYTDVNKEVLKELIRTYRKVNPELKNDGHCAFCGGEHK